MRTHGRKTRCQFAIAEALALLAALCLIYWPLLFQRTLTTGGDLATYFFPNFVWAAATIAGEPQSIQPREISPPIAHWSRSASPGAADFPLWNPFNYNGQPFAAAAQSAVFYPPARILWTLLRGDPARAINLYIFAHIAIAALGILAFVRSRAGLGLSHLPGAGAIAGLSFAGSSWFWSSTENVATLATTAWFGWVVLAFGMLASPGRSFRSTEANRALTILGAASVLALAFLAGHPQQLFYALLVAASWWLYRLARSARGTTWRATLPALACTLAAAGLAALLVGILFLPMHLLSAHSYRIFDDTDYAKTGSLVPRALLLWLAPHAFGSALDGYPGGVALGELGVFIGWVPVLLAVMCLPALRRNPSRILWVALFLAGNLLALGGYGDPRRLFDFAATGEAPDVGYSPLWLLLKVCPPAIHFRAPARAILISHFALITLALFGYRCLLARVAPGGLRRTATAILIFSLSAVSLTMVARKSALHIRASYDAPIEVLSRGAGIPVPSAAPLDHRIYRLTQSDDTLVASERPGTPTEVTRRLNIDQRLMLRARRLTPNTNLLSRRALADCYEEGLLPTISIKDFYFSFNKSIRTSYPDPQLLAILGIRWIWADVPVVQTNGFKRVHSSPFFGDLHENAFWRGIVFTPEEFPGVDYEKLIGTYWGPEARATPRGAQTFRSYLRDGSILDPYTMPLLPPSTAPRPWHTDIVTPNLLLLTPPPPLPAATTSTGPQRLLVSMATFPGWTAAYELPDGRWQRTPLKPKGAALWQLDAPPSSRILLSFEPWLFRLGAFLTLVGLALAAALAAFGLRRS